MRPSMQSLWPGAVHGHRQSQVHGHGSRRSLTSRQPAALFFDSWHSEGKAWACVVRAENVSDMTVSVGASRRTAYYITTHEQSLSRKQCQQCVTRFFRRTQTSDVHSSHSARSEPSCFRFPGLAPHEHPGHSLINLPACRAQAVALQVPCPTSWHKLALSGPFKDRARHVAFDFLKLWLLPSSGIYSGIYGHMAELDEAQAPMAV